MFRLIPDGCVMWSLKIIGIVGIPTRERAADIDSRRSLMRGQIYSIGIVYFRDLLRLI